ncbi:MAG: GGDEF domain-containing protein [Candidatus Acididesulfobacter guangdongensis]|uniref:GGDEF domain-containing protein n=1 Tax=Acididesulfobacter guangdongensis TaxID=2597225 RepID=A0A519BIN2_ACIG2|nr:MAG: GGDEF domain-containing protein [Candidatus Acididesulfobacter guangdongensis]
MKNNKEINNERLLWLTNATEKTLNMIINSGNYSGAGVNSQTENRFGIFIRKEILNGIDKLLDTDFTEFIIYDVISKKIKNAVFSDNWDKNIKVSSIAPEPTKFVKIKISENILGIFNYQNDEYATEVFKKMDVRDIILYSFNGANSNRFLAVSGVVKRNKNFFKNDADFYKNAMTLFAAAYEMQQLYEKLNSSLKLEKLNKKLNLINNLAYNLSLAYCIEYALKIFAEALFSIKTNKIEKIKSIHINIFDSLHKKTLTSMIYLRDKKPVFSHPVDYKEYVGNCKLFRDDIIVNNKQCQPHTYAGNNNKGGAEVYNRFKSDESAEVGETDEQFTISGENICGTENAALKNVLNNNDKKEVSFVDNCEFHGTDGSYNCYPINISGCISGSVNIESDYDAFFSKNIQGLITEIINIAAPFFAKLILIEYNKELAITDSLTGIYNRRFMYEFAKMEISRAIRNKSPLSFGIIDIDKFKEINDTYGHYIGDSILKEFADDLRKLFMRKQDLITRYGGDEFIVILPETDRDNAAVLLNRFNDFVAHKVYMPNSIENIKINLTVSIGGSSFSPETADIGDTERKKGNYKTNTVDSAINTINTEVQLLQGGKKNKNKNASDNKANIEHDGQGENYADENISIIEGLFKIADANLYKAKEMGRNTVVI